MLSELINHSESVESYAVHQQLDPTVYKIEIRTNLRTLEVALTQGSEQMKELLYELETALDRGLGRARCCGR